ncbi:VTC domain-containing protein [Planococcus plakortidis]|uniref:polyphosphate polymerase domain-containing protein n=1 Tax=Planococcus plakortidis TaxID=1038856 RepID=UPI003859BD21
MAIEIFSRKEQKYLITRKQYEALIHELAPYMRDDRNGKDGRYTVSSLYFDNAERAIYYETKNKLRYRQKLRLRVYGDTGPDGLVFFEVKQKHGKVVYKRRLTMPLSEAHRYLAAPIFGLADDYESSNPQVLREIDYFRRLYGLEPTMIVAYDRHAMHGKSDSDLRITFDFNLRCRRDELQLDKGPHGDHFIDPGLVVMEVKVDHSVPLWLARILQKQNCEQRSASKFCTSTEQLAETDLVQAGFAEQTTIGGDWHGKNQ